MCTALCVQFVYTVHVQYTSICTLTDQVSHLHHHDDPMGQASSWQKMLAMAVWMDKAADCFSWGTGSKWGGGCQCFKSQWQTCKCNSFRRPIRRRLAGKQLRLVSIWKTATTKHGQKQAIFYWGRFARPWLRHEAARGFWQPIKDKKTSQSSAQTWITPTSS